MTSQTTYCESCKTNLSEIETVLDGDGLPFKLCKPCHQRLISKALRPLEYFNLVAIHGHDFYLHDDFYDDNGEATQPETEVTDANLFPFPELDNIQNNLDKLVDFAIVQYFTSDKVIALLQRHNKKEVLETIDKKIKVSRAINYKAYEIIARTLGDFAADWVRQEWNNRKEDELLILSEAISKCLPFDEGFTLITTEIEKANNKSLSDLIGALLHFQNNRTLKWIETVKDRIENIKTSWGVLAAASDFDWQTAKHWIDNGRPLSIVALDALVYCTTTDNRANQSFWLQQHPPKLSNAERPEIIATIVNEYLQKDNVPRTKSAVKNIIDNIFVSNV